MQLNVFYGRNIQVTPRPQACSILPNDKWQFIGHIDLEEIGDIGDVVPETARAAIATQGFYALCKAVLRPDWQNVVRQAKF